MRHLGSWHSKIRAASTLSFSISARNGVVVNIVEDRSRVPSSSTSAPQLLAPVEHRSSQPRRGSWSLRSHKSKPQAVTAIAAKVSLLDATSEGWATFPFGADRLVCPALRSQTASVTRVSSQSFINAKALKKRQCLHWAARPACSQKLRVLGCI